MTYYDGGSLAAPTSAEARVRTLVRMLAYAALVAGVATTVLLFGTADPAVWWAAWMLLVVAGAVAAGCLWHGARHQHERGRAAAAVALLVVLPVFLLTSWALVRERCPNGPPVRHCFDGAGRG